MARGYRACWNDPHSRRASWSRHSRAMAPCVIIGERAAEIWRRKHTRDLALRPVSRRARQKARARLRMKLGARGVLALLPPD